MLVYAGIAAIGAIGLNLLTGYTGQVSLGHAFFIGTGAYVTAYFGGQRTLAVPGLHAGRRARRRAHRRVVGPFALRLRGNYLAIITLGLVFIGQHVFENWTSVTGGLNGHTGDCPANRRAAELRPPRDLRSPFHEGRRLLLPDLDPRRPSSRSRRRTSPGRGAGRAMQAVRDRDVAAEVIGIRLARYKVLAFVVSSSLAAVAGAVLGSYQQFVAPGDFGLLSRSSTSP